MAAEAATMPATNLMPSGLHFGVPEDRYHADHALGSGSIRDLATCPMYYWLDSYMNPLRREAGESQALVIGRAIHKMVLEGPQAYSDTFKVIPSPADYPEALVTTDDVKSELRRLGLKLTGNKPELIERLREADPGAVFFDDVKADFDRSCTAGVTPLKADEHEEVIRIAGAVARNPRIRPAFQGGRSEVTLFWERDGVPCKARLDYLRLGQVNGRPTAIISDLKSYANALGKPPERAVLDAIANTRLDVQAAHYLEGARRIPEWIRAGKVYGAKGINQEWLDALAAIEPDAWMFAWVFVEKGAPITLMRSVAGDSPIIEAANMDVRRALEAYRDHMEAFGTDWQYVDPIPDPALSGGDLPKWMYLTA